MDLRVTAFLLVAGCWLLLLPLLVLALTFLLLLLLLLRRRFYSCIKLRGDDDDDDNYASYSFRFFCFVCVCSSATAGLLYDGRMKQLLKLKFNLFLTARGKGTNSNGGAAKVDGTKCCRMLYGNGMDSRDWHFAERKL